MPFRQTTVSGLPAVALRSDELEVVAVPAVGMKLTNLRRPRGREWLWRDAAPIGAVDSGGWDECFPTAAPSPVPGAPPDAPALPDRGELWDVPWTSSTFEHADGTTLAASAQGRLLTYQFHREVTLDPHDPVMRLRYRVRNTGGSPFPWIWSAHPVFNVQPGSTVELPSMRQVKLGEVHGLPELSPGDIMSWPDAFGGERGRFVFPGDGAWAVKLFGDVGTSGRAILTDPRRGERLEIAVAPNEVPQVGIRINNGGWAPPGRQPFCNLSLEPAIGAPDRLEDAVRDWGAAQTLAPGEERSWGLEVWLLEKDETSGEAR
jgi:hypothetical protein